MFWMPGAGAPLCTALNRWHLTFLNYYAKSPNLQFGAPKVLFPSADVHCPPIYATAQCFKNRAAILWCAPRFP